eukprot:c1231_g1_i1.p1 GENE.c1231_g1_i1~~c1231_g1_i1.p1  ORF type:complete len:150 (-),score=25.95 c1231_g1_i1:69-482(-)
MGSITPLIRRKKEIKKKTHFQRHHADRYKRIGRKVTWRKPKGIDSCVRRRFKGTIAMPKIGYGNNKKTRHVLPNGFKKFTVNNARELDVLMMQNRAYAAEISHAVSAKKRSAIVRRAAQLNIKVLNPQARLNTRQRA